MKLVAAVVLSLEYPSRSIWISPAPRVCRQKVETKLEGTTSKSLEFLLTYSTRSVMSIFPNPSPTPENQPPAAPPPSAVPPQYAAPQYAQPPYAPAPYYPPPPAPESGTGMKIPLLFGAVVALLGANVYLYMQLDHVKKDLASTNTAMQAQFDKLQEASSLTTKTNSRRVDELKEQLERARRQAAQAAGAAKEEAL